jgi:DNA-binding beta-propeller fold protein YncE
MILIMLRRMMRITGAAAAGLGAAGLAALGATGTAGATAGPHAMGALPVTTAYVANTLSDSVTPINIITGTRGPAITVHGGPDQIAVTPDGATAYVVALRNMPRMPGFVLPINTGAGAADRPIYVGHEPLSIAFAP